MCKLVEGSGRTCAPCDAPPAIAGNAAEQLARGAHEALLRAERDKGFVTGAREDRTIYFQSDAGMRSDAGRGLAATTLASVNALLSATTVRLEFFRLTTVGYSGPNRVHVRVDYYLQDWGDDPRGHDEAESHHFYCAVLDQDRWRLTDVVNY